jgi:hypothetical protein
MACSMNLPKFASEKPPASRPTLGCGAWLLDMINGRPLPRWGQ